MGNQLSKLFRPKSTRASPAPDNDPIIIEDDDPIVVAPIRSRKRSNTQSYPNPPKKQKFTEAEVLANLAKAVNEFNASKAAPVRGRGRPKGSRNKATKSNTENLVLDKNTVALISKMVNDFELSRVNPPRVNPPRGGGRRGGRSRPRGGGILNAKTNLNLGRESTVRNQGFPSEVVAAIAKRVKNHPPESVKAGEHVRNMPQMGESSKAKGKEKVIDDNGSDIQEYDIPALAKMVDRYNQRNEGSTMFIDDNVMNNKHRAADYAADNEEDYVYDDDDDDDE